MEQKMSAAVHPSAAVARVNERVHPDLREHAGALGRNLPQQCADNPLRQVVGFNLVAECEPAEFGRETPMPADDTLHEADVREMIQAAFATIPLPCCVNEREIARRGGLKKPLLQRHCQRLGMPGSDEAADDDSRATGNRSHGLGGGNDAGQTSHGKRGARNAERGTKR